MKKKYWYSGTLSYRKKAEWPPELKKAMDSFRAQRTRCSNKNQKNWAYYGAKGIKVRYETREFVGWYLEQLKTRKWKDPTVGRIDHDKDYTFDNIEMQERSDNSRERNTRKPQIGPKPRHWRSVVASKGGVPFATFLSVTDAAKFFGLKPPSVSNICSGRAKVSASGYNFHMLGKNHALKDNPEKYRELSNVKAPRNRGPRPAKWHLMFDARTDEKLVLFKSLAEAAYYTGLSKSYISGLVCTKKARKDGSAFKTMGYVEY